MNTQIELESRLAQIESVIKSYQGQAKRIKNELVQFCPVKIGDTVTVNGCSYKGQPMMVEKIICMTEKQWNHKEAKYKCTGPILKKDGTPGKNVGVCYV